MPRVPSRPPAARWSRASASSTPSKPRSPARSTQTVLRHRRASSRSLRMSPVTTQAAANVRDNFETGSFANNDGTHRWYGDWVEQNDNNSPYGGKVIDRLARARRQSHDHRRQRRHLSPRRHAFERDVSVTLKLNYSRASLEAGEYVAVQASANGGTTWTEVGRISGAGNDYGLHRQELQHHCLPRPQHRDPFRELDERSVPRRLRRPRRRRDRLQHHVRRRRSAARRRERQAAASAGIRGREIGVAIIDTGYWKAQFARPGFERATAAWPCSTTRSPTPWSATGRRSPPTPPAMARTSPASSPAAARRAAANTSASRPTRASSRSRPSAKMARAPTPR